MSRLSPVLATGRTTALAVARLCLCLRFRLSSFRRLLEWSTDATTAAVGTPRATTATTSPCIGTSAPGLSTLPPSSASPAASSWFGPSAATGAAAPAGRSRTLLTAHEKTSGMRRRIQLTC